MTSQDDLITHTKALACASIVTSVMGILGNAFVLAVYGPIFREISTCKRLILHLAFSDLTFAIFQIANSAPMLYTLGWPYGAGACKFIPSSLLLGGLVAIGTMLVIAIERYLGIIYCMKFMNSTRRVAYALVAVWLTAIATTIPVTMAMVFDPSTKYCEEQWSQMGLTDTGRTFYDFFLLIAWFVIPLFIIFFCYGSIINLLRKPLHKRGFACEKSAEFAKKRRREDFRVVNTLIVVVVVFALCCLPVRIIWILFNYIDYKTLSHTELFTVLYIKQLSYPLHVAVNPVIYCLVDDEFRKELRKMLSCGRNLHTKKKVSKDINPRFLERNPSNILLSNHTDWLQKVALAK